MTNASKFNWLLSSVEFNSDEFYNVNYSKFFGIFLKFPNKFFINSLLNSEYWEVFISRFLMLINSAKLVSDWYFDVAV